MLASLYLQALWQLEYMHGIYSLIALTILPEKYVKITKKYNTIKKKKERRRSASVRETREYYPFPARYFDWTNYGIDGMKLKEVIAGCYTTLFYNSSEVFWKTRKYLVEPN